MHEHADTLSKDVTASEDAAVERRIRSMAHYAAATAAMERGQRAEALEEFEQAALADPTNEKIVLEVVRMLLAPMSEKPCLPDS